ncbi:hypothetical protein C8R47DRAFT_1064416 [Mycena vitilis]|nr:hypothetical protein C8R47DRAFT_1064416 [Mycena vitilis]
MEECFENVLESVLVHVKRSCDYQNLKYIALLNARLKLALYLLQVIPDFLASCETKQIFTAVPVGLRKLFHTPRVWLTKKCLFEFMARSVNERVAAQEKIERVRLADPSGATRAEDRSLVQFQPLCNANGHDPRLGPYVTPEHKSWSSMSSREYVDSICYDPAGRPGRVPFITLVFGTCITSWLAGGAMTVVALREAAHDPDWRTRMNNGTPPGQLKLRSGARDVEHIF